MRFKSVGTDGFGCLKNWQCPQIDSDLVVVYGRNESGKTTLFNLLTTILYGWYPATKDRNVYMPWDKSVATCNGVLTTDDRKELEISRTLRSRATSSLTFEGKNISLGNDALVQVAFLPRLIYSEVFAVTIEQLRFPEKRAWDKLQDQLLGGQYTNFLRPVSLVLDELESDATQLWRPDRRGKPKAKELRARIRLLNKEKREAQENEELLRRVEERLETTTLEIEKLLSHKTSIVLALDRAERLVPVYKKVKRVDELMAGIVDTDILAELPPDPGKDLAELDRQISNGQAKKGDLSEGVRVLEKEKESFTPRDEQIYSLADEIRPLSKSHGQLEIDLQRDIDLENEIESYTGRMFERARDLLQGGWQEGLASAVEKIDEAELKSAIEGFKKTEAHYTQQKARIEGLKVRAAAGEKYKHLPMLSVFSLLLAAIGLSFSDNPVLGFASVLVGFLGIVLILVWWTAKGDRTAIQELAEAEGRLKDLETVLEEKRDAVKAALLGLPVATSWLEWPGESLLLEVSRLKSFLFTRLEKMREKENVRGRIGEKEALVSRLLQACGPVSAEGPKSDLLENINQLEARLIDAENARDVSIKASEKIAELNSELKQVAKEISKNEVRRSELLASLSKIDGAGIDEKISNLTSLRKRYNQAVALNDDLVREYPDLDGILEEIRAIKQGQRAGERTENGRESSRITVLEAGSDTAQVAGPETAQVAGSETAPDAAQEAGPIAMQNAWQETAPETAQNAWPENGREFSRIAVQEAGSDTTQVAGPEGFLLSDQERARLKVEREQVDDQLNQLKEEAGQLKTDLEHRQNQTRLDDIEGEIAQIESDYEETYIARDRLQLLKNIIFEADKRFRDEHQPEILSLAGNYLKTITAGRYDRLYLKDEKEPGLVVRGDYYNSPIDVALLSRGALRQVYLALRLALIDHLDGAGERLPVFLDEVLVHWDDERLSCGLDLLEQLSKKRQVFLFTCHQWIVDRLTDMDQVQVVNM